MCLLRRRRDRPNWRSATHLVVISIRARDRGAETRSAAAVGLGLGRIPGGSIPTWDRPSDLRAVSPTRRRDLAFGRARWWWIRSPGGIAALRPGQPRRSARPDAPSGDAIPPADRIRDLRAPSPT